jgi:hypothetical protein
MTKPITDFPVTPIYFVKFDNVGPSPQIDSQNLGLMLPGVSRHPNDLFPAVLLSPFDYKKDSPGDPGGVSIRVERANSNTSIASRTFYLGLPLQIGRAETLVAQITFDLPDAFTQTNSTTPEVPSNAKWAVGLNFKDGSQDDLSSDQVNVGATCHFVANGQPQLNSSTNTTDPPPPPSSYANYQTQRTSFQLTVRVRRTFTAGSGEASLQVGDVVQRGQLNATTPPTIHPVDFTAAGDGFKQVGIVIVNIQPPTTIVRARLQSFKLWMNP